MKIFSLNSQLATAIALSSALLLTACGGNSHSSGDTKSEKNENKPSIIKPQTKKSKIDKLVGYWKAECDKDGEKGSYYEYFQLVKHGKNGLKFNQFVTEDFTTSDCTGKSTFVDENEEDDFLTQDDIDRTTFQGNNVFIGKSKDGTKTKYTRVQKKDFPVVK